MSERRSSPWLRALRGGVAAGILFLLVGDRGTAAVVCGVDPLDILNLQVKNNVAVVLDTSGSMKWPVDLDNFPIGGDDPMSRLYQAKQALKAVVAANSGRLNFGMLTYNIQALQKPLNQSQDFDNEAGGGKDDGPFIYVSADAPGQPSNAGSFYNVFNCNNGGNVDGYFCLLDNTFGNYDGTGSADVFRSFGNRRGTNWPGSNLFSDPYPTGCTPGVDCRYYLHSRLFRSGISYRWRGAGITDPTTALMSVTPGFACPLPRVGIVGDNPDLDGDGFSDRPQPCIQFVDNNTGASAVFYYTSAIFQLQSGASCGGALTMNPVPNCVTDYTENIIHDLAQELPVISGTQLNGNLTANAVQNYTDGVGTNPTNDNPPGPVPSPQPSPLPSPAAGVRADQSTPIAGSIQFIRTAAAPVFPAVPPPVQGIQKNFVLILSDGDDTCAAAGDQDGDGDSNDLDDRAIFAARQAQALYDPSVEDEQHTAETMFVAFASAINIGRSNKIAQAGSGGIVGVNGVVTCPPNVPCRPAFTANSTDELIAVLNQALDLVLSTGEFSAAPSIVSTVFELGPLTDTLPPTDPNRVDPMNPDTRYNSRVNILYQPTFELPDFSGHLYAFLNDGSFLPAQNFTGNWDAGETLFEQVSQSCLEVGNEGHGVNLFTFTELHDGRTARDITGKACATGDVLIRRRIFTSSPVAGTGGSDVNRSYVRNAGVLNQWDGSQTQGTNVVALWPPNQAGLDSGVSEIDPAVGIVGPLDDALGIGPGSDPVLPFSALRSRLRACEGSLDTGGPPAACDDIVNPTLALDTARKEGRQILLTWLAGGKVALSSGPVDPNKAMRDASDPARPLLFSNRGWIMGDSTLGAPAVVGPPLQGAPSEHLIEFALFRDGRRSSVDQQGIDDLDRGFGLRNPDFDDANPPLKTNLKPTMTTVFFPTNHLLHAFRAGPNCGPLPNQPFDPTQCTEAGSEEQWAYMPFDQLGKILEIISPPVGVDHTFVLSSSVRVADIFIPGNFSLVDNGVTVNYTGRWRTVLFVGRGAGGKFYTAIDVTAPGPFTRLALDTNPPFVMWNIGNEDPVAGVDPTSDDEYDGMGQSWSVPAVGNVAQAPSPNLPEWRVWVGSGCGDNPANFEGKCFFMLDAVTGANIGASPFVVGDGNTTFITDNALPAGPAAYNAFQLDPPGELNRSPNHVTRVYIPDLHGRIWKFDTSSGGMVADEGPAQPFGVPVALLKLADQTGLELPHVFAAAGNDRRVPDTNPFKVFGYQDTAPDGDVATPLTKLFEQSFPGPVPGISEGFRGTVQPATVFSEDTDPSSPTFGQLFGRVFFVGTRFNFTTIDCISTFDTILFGLGAVSGNAVYDFDNDGSADLSTIVEGVRATVLQATGGQLLIGDSGGLGRPPSPPPPPASPFPSPQAAQPAQVITTDLKPGSPVCRVQ